METLIQADIFFFISSIATIILTVLVSILLFYLIKVWRNLHLLLEILKNNYKESEEYVSDLIDRLEDNLIFRIFFPPVRKKKGTKADKDK